MNSIASTTIYRLLISHNLLEFGKRLFQIFLVIFIFDQTNSVRDVAIYSMTLLLVHTVIFLLMGSTAKRGHTHILRHTGLFILIVTLVCVAILQKEAIHYLVLIASTFATGNSLYWLSHHIMRFDLTHKKNRSNYIGFEKGLSISANLLAPLIGGTLIGLFGDVGYIYVFILSAISFFFSGLCTFRLALPSIDHKRLHLKKTWAILKKNKDLMNMLYSHIFSNIGRRGAIEKFLPILLFDILQSEYELGWLLTLLSVFAVVTSLYVGKIVSDTRYKSLMTMGTSLLFLAFISLAGFPSFITYIIFGVANQILSAIIHVSKATYASNLIHQIPNENDHRIEWFMIREIFAIGIGRASGFIPLLLITSLTTQGIQMVILTMACCILIESYFLRSIKTVNISA